MESILEVYGYLNEFYKEWHPVFHTLFKASGYFLPRPLNYFPLDQKWEAKENITLLGDAAHLMPPSGEGVNVAMLDAVDLCGYLTDGNYENLSEAIASYKEHMLLRAAGLAKEALVGIKDFASPSEQSIKKLIEIFRAKKAQ